MATALKPIVMDETPSRVTERRPVSSSTNVVVGVAENPPAASRPMAILIHGERFGVEYEPGQVYIAHPQWSLVGAGRSLAQAIDDLFDEIRYTAEELGNDNDAILSPEAQRLRMFVLQVRGG